MSKSGTPKIFDRTISPIDNHSSKDVSSAKLRKDESWAKSSNRTQTITQSKNNTLNPGNSKDLLSLSSLHPSHNRRLSEKTDANNIHTTSMIAKDDEYSSHLFHSISKQISDGPNREFIVLNNTIQGDQSYITVKPAKRGRKSHKTEVDLHQRFYTVSNNSISNILESEDMNSQRHTSIGGRLSSKENENEGDRSHSEIRYHESEVSPSKKKLFEHRRRQFIPFQRQESHENVLDEFAEKSMQVSVQDHNQSFALSSTGRPIFDDILGQSLISYLEEKGTGMEKSKKEIESKYSD